MIYIIGEKGSESAIKVTTIQVHDNLYSLIKSLSNMWLNRKYVIPTYEDFVKFIKNSWTYKLYTNGLNKDQKPKRVNRKIFWDEIEKDSKAIKIIKKVITKAALREVNGRK